MARRIEKHRRPSKPVVSNYVVDERAVADAIIARLRGSSMLVPSQALEAPAAGPRERQA
jgi:hypothetical protein